MASPLTDLDRRLLDLAQARVPLSPTPYAVLALSLGCGESTVLERMAAMTSRDEPVIREIAGVFEAAALGHQSTLVVCSVPEAELQRTGAIIAAHPGVSHCYSRRHRLNLWFTLTLGPDSRLGLDRTASRLSELIGAEARLLPMVERFKIGVHVAADGRMNSTASSQPAPLSQPAALTDTEKAAVSVLQADLAVVPRPFDALAAAAGLSVGDLLAIGRDFLARGVLRRYAAMVHHRRAGLVANAMVVWRVADEQNAGRIASAEPSVSHCYLRRPAPDWPYTLYTMIHARTDDECRGLIDALAGAIDPIDHAVLWTDREFKKAKVRFFTGATPAWEAANTA